MRGMIIDRATGFIVPVSIKGERTMYVVASNVPRDQEFASSRARQSEVARSRPKRELASAKTAFMIRDHR